MLIRSRTVLGSVSDRARETAISNETPEWDKEYRWVLQTGQKISDIGDWISL